MLGSYHLNHLNKKKKKSAVCAFFSPGKIEKSKWPLTEKKKIVESFGIKYCTPPALLGKVLPLFELSMPQSPYSHLLANIPFVAKTTKKPSMV
jgi:hypothetical protein